MNYLENDYELRLSQAKNSFSDWLFIISGKGILEKLSTL